MVRLKYLITAFLLSVLLLCGCGSTVRQFPLHQSTENIIKIELLKNNATIEEPNIDFSVVCELPEESFAEFMDSLLHMTCYKYFGDMPTEIGTLAIRITYSNGDIEIVGNDNNAYFTSKKQEYGIFHFDYAEFHDLFAQYVDESLLPEMD